MTLTAAEPMRVVYFGTPAFAVPALEILADDPRVDLRLVVTQPDRPAGRGRKLSPPEVKVAAVDRGLPVYQPERLGTAEDRIPIAEAAADIFVVAAYGKIFGPKLLSLPKHRCVNLHASLLPSYRGASPISAAILEGREVTGISLMQMDSGLDTGPILAQRSIAIEATDSTASLTPRLGLLGAQLLSDVLEELRFGTLVPTVQDDRNASITRPMRKSDGWIDWTSSANEIERQIRAMWDWPRAWTTLNGEPVQIHRASIDDIASNMPIGTIETAWNKPAVVTSEGRLLIEIAQSPGGRPLPGDAWLHQTKALGARLGERGAPETPTVPFIRPAGY